MTLTDSEERILAMAGPLWLRLLQEKERTIITRMHADYTSGTTDFHATVAQLVVVREQIATITNKLRELE